MEKPSHNQEKMKINKSLKEKCIEEDFDILHKCIEAYNSTELKSLGIEKWTEKDTRDWISVNNKLFWTLYSCIVETKIKYKFRKLTNRGR